MFRKVLGPAERSLLSELRDHRNKWAHQEPFSSDDAYPVLDSAGRLRLRFDEQVRGEKRKTASGAIESATTARA